ncbi:hypothetical protein [Candidatus Lokiarchaeum ossiferum]|uniref:hypothetical protein n=1 Tax=Candidatus Lokiarchaeum ossiferum TaxID=2951803 RepID=UPI00352C91A6
MIFMTPAPEINWLDAILEGLSLLGFVFILVMAFYAKKKNKIFASKGFPLMILAISMGLISAFMDLISEFYWMDNYELFKSVMSILLIVGFSLFALSLILVFKFTQFMMGEE